MDRQDWNKNDWDKVQQDLYVGDIVLGQVCSIWDFGILVDLGYDVPGFIDRINISDGLSQKSWFYIGKEIQAVVVGFAEYKEIRLSLRADSKTLKENWQKWKMLNPIGAIFDAYVRLDSNGHVLCQIDSEKYPGILVATQGMLGSYSEGDHLIVRIVEYNDHIQAALIDIAN